MDKEEICKKVMNLDPLIRFAGLINPNGRLVAGGMKPGYETLEDPKDAEMLYMELVLRAKMRKEFDRAFGPVKFAMSLREKLIVMSFPFEDHILMISTEKQTDFSKLAFKVLEIITH
jgi:hypothetical protein